VKILVFARAGSLGPRHRNTVFASKAHPPRTPKRMKALPQESLSVLSLELFEAGKHPHVFSRPSGTIEFAPIRKALRSTMALRVQCLASGDEHQGHVGLGPIEANRYATESHATETFKEHTSDGR